MMVIALAYFFVGHAEAALLGHRVVHLRQPALGALRVERSAKPPPTSSPFVAGPRLAGSTCSPPATLALEVGFPLCLAFPRLRWIFVPGVVSLHLGIYLDDGAGLLGAGSVGDYRLRRLAAPRLLAGWASASASAAATIPRLPELEVRNLTKRYGKTLAVDDLSFSVEAGRVTGFLGPNGAGKTTTMRALLGLVRPTRGEALVDGGPPAEMSDPLRTVGAALEATAFHPGRSGRNHLRVLAASAGIPGSRVAEVLEMVELTGAAGRRVKGYSLGMRQRLALAAALLGEPRILILDEPANGLDPQGMRWLRDLLRAQAAEGRTVLVSSHLLSEVAQTADELIVIRDGKLVAQASLDEFTSGAGEPDAGACPRPGAARPARRAAAPRSNARATARCWSAARAARQIGDAGARRRGRDARTGAAALEPRGALPRGHRGGDGVSLLRGELLKLVTVRTTWMMLGIGLLVEGLFAGLFVGLVTSTNSTR